MGLTLLPSLDHLTFTDYTRRTDIVVLSQSPSSKIKRNRRWLTGKLERPVSRPGAIKLLAVVGQGSGVAITKTRTSSILQHQQLHGDNRRDSLHAQFIAILALQGTVHGLVGRLDLETGSVYGANGGEKGGDDGKDLHIGMISRVDCRSE